MKGLVVKEHWLNKIFSGKKTWELRGSRTKIRGRIALIMSGSGKVFGTVDLVECIGPISKAELIRNRNKHQVDFSEASGGEMYRTTFAWILRNPKRFARPKAYAHPPGAIIWVNLGTEGQKAKRHSRRR